ncbi:MAG: leucine-rich repeat domain-containing protein [Oscillospiraceae bacterium]
MLSYYSEKKADDILVEIVERELAEFSGGVTVSSAKIVVFVIRRLVKGLVPLIVAALFGLMMRLVVPFVIVAAIFEIVSLVKYFSNGCLVMLISEEAKKAPDKKISTIISEICECGNSGAFALRTTKSVRKPKIKPIAITLCVVFGLIIAGGAAYLFAPITLYSRTDDGYVITLCRTGLSGDAKIDPYRNGEPIVGIKSGAFKNNFFLKSVELPDSLTFIEGEAFMNCVALKSIEIPPRVTEIRGDTFHDCKTLTTVKLHDNITALHAACFMGCESLREIKLPRKITEIRENTFNGCYSLMRIDIPEGVTRIAARAFFDCNSLSDVTIPKSVTEIGSSSFRSCENLSQVVIRKGCSVNERAFKESPTVISYY